LLLNLKDASGWLHNTLSATGVARLSQLANALEMDEESLARLWNELLTGRCQNRRIARITTASNQRTQIGRERLAPAKRVYLRTMVITETFINL
jgi:hypothetical protein